MRNVVIMAFTAKGYELAEKIEQALSSENTANKDEENTRFSHSENASGELSISVHRVSRLLEFVPLVFQTDNILVFIGAVGIAVRAISGLIKDKTTDPAVIVIDELGRYVIPILSGHIGGANQFAAKLSGLIHAEPVITTATDINKVFSVDTFALQNRYAIVNPDVIKLISGALLDGRDVGLCTTLEIEGELPAGIILKNNGDIGILIAAEECENPAPAAWASSTSGLPVRPAPFIQTLWLMPKCFHVGIGTRKGISFETLEEVFLEVLSREAIPILCVGSISSIDIKKDEDAICRLSEAYGIGFITYSARQLKVYEQGFEQSDFVRKTTGVGNVCEVSAYLSSGKGKIIVGKLAKNGVTIAVAQEAWRVRFENTNDRS